ncbi:MAG: hypothetical protein ACK5N9_02965 [Pirellula sp.]
MPSSDLLTYDSQSETVSDVTLSYHMRRRHTAGWKSQSTAFRYRWLAQPEHVFRVLDRGNAIPGLPDWLVPSEALGS